MTNQQKAEIRKTQAILTKITVGSKVFFNIVNYRDKLGLVKEYNGNWILTNKGKMIMNIVV